MQNLFYLNNVVHDILYSHGFTEAAGNFQIDNFGSGGSGNDAVKAEAQDGGGTDNANFATPPDGRKPADADVPLVSGPGPTHEVAITSPVGVSYDAAAALRSAPRSITTGLTRRASPTASPADACTAVRAAVSGKIALIDRGTCDFALKAKNAAACGRDRRDRRQQPGRHRDHHHGRPTQRPDGRHSRAS